MIFTNTSKELQRFYSLNTKKRSSRVWTHMATDHSGKGNGNDDEDDGIGAKAI